MKRVIMLAVIALALAGCGIESKNVKLPDGSTVVCARDENIGSISCDWDHVERNGTK